MLHLISQADLSAALIDRIDVGDVVIFLENAVLRTVANSASSLLIAGLLKHNQVYVMADQLIVRGIGTDELVTGIKVIDYEQLVDLTIKHAVIQSWT
ncbi:MAG: sulfurtransferase complex subunit TusB [Methylococcales bacterium]